MALPRFAQGLAEYPPPRRRSWRNLILISVAVSFIITIFWNSRNSVREYYNAYSRPSAAPHVSDADSPAMPHEPYAAEGKHEFMNELEEQYVGVAGNATASTFLSTSTASSTASHSTHNSMTHSDTLTLSSTSSASTSSSTSSSTVPPSSSSLRKPSPTPSGPPIPDDTPIDHSNPTSRLPLEFQNLLQWEPPVWASLHLPPYSEFIGRDYDPNVWENFTINNEFFKHGYLTAAETATNSPKTYNPYPRYNDIDWKNQWRGSFVPCEGVQGKNFNESDDEKIKAYDHKPNGFPNAPVGSWDAIGVDGSVCFDRMSRLGAFGIGDDLDFGGLKLGELQNKCVQRNRDRYEHARDPEMRPPMNLVEQTPEEYMKSAKIKAYKPVAPGPQYKSRTAVLIRSWEGYAYQDNDVQAIRSVVSELALQSGGEYQVFLFVNIKDEDDSIFMDEGAYQSKMLEIPEELRDITLFWTEKQMSWIYPAVNEYRVNLAQFMPVQWFMETHPEFEHVWNWEMDARLIGHHYHFVEAVNLFALQQPRKYLWERNARYYLPNIHGSYSEFFKDTNRQIKESPYVSTIWGPMLVGEVIGPEPSVSEDEDNFEWGVGEEADFISLLPIWDPARPTWGWKEAMWNYPQDSPRRAYINTHARYSRRLLGAMHMENLNGRHMTSELWPTSIALHHGLKAVYAPQPIWLSHEWPDYYIDAVFNAEGWGAGSFYNYSEPADDGINQPLNHPEWGRGVAYNETLARLQLPQTGTGPNGEGAMGRWGQERDSPYNLDREHNFMGWSWYYSSDFAKIVYARWLGWEQSFTGMTIGWRPANEVDELWDAGTEEWEAEHGRLCLPSMLLHPVKHVAKPGSEEDQEDPANNGQMGSQGQEGGHDANNYPEFVQNGQSNSDQNQDGQDTEQSQGQTDLIQEHESLDSASGSTRDNSDSTNDGAQIDNPWAQQMSNDFENTP